MILVWRGWGIVVIAIAFMWFCVAIAISALIHADTDGSVAITGLCLVPAGVVTWFVGRRMNRDATRILIDPATGGEVVVRRDHSFFFLRVEWWGPIMVVLGIGLFVLEAFVPVRR
jgi:hypothetical protein